MLFTNMATIFLISIFLFLGFMLLAGRVRKQEEVDIIQTVIQKHFKRKLNPDGLFSEESIKKELGKFIKMNKH